MQLELPLAGYRTGTKPFGPFTSWHIARKPYPKSESLNGRNCLVLDSADRRYGFSRWCFQPSCDGCPGHRVAQLEGLKPIPETR